MAKVSNELVAPRKDIFKGDLVLYNNEICIVGELSESHTRYFLINFEGVVLKLYDDNLQVDLDESVILLANRDNVEIVLKGKAV